jgi:hypothetical protein
MPEIRRPKKGEKFEVIEPFLAYVLTLWKAPFTGGYERELPRGLRFIVSRDPPPSANSVAAEAKATAQWESVLVEERDRNAQKYDGYYLVIKFENLEANCIGL